VGNVRYLAATTAGITPLDTQLYEQLRVRVIENIIDYLETLTGNDKE
jgi:hypothetical protein